ncbi:hypothetical protein MLD38_037566 [Melastoma candidum]|uniref:Uncharacterized protein n=1 Tax=Melastoma candidum TaxID=119954 RepID=A0ACB9LNS1_9MYRT|nr:hypothetical protein MLD38_040445 [Melastoma candidum]KAI4312772.1 hypothetical protein MLD38_037566 [Melastoma candidum]
MGVQGRLENRRTSRAEPVIVGRVSVRTGRRRRERGSREVVTVVVIPTAVIECLLMSESSSYEQCRFSIL